MNRKELTKSIDPKYKIISVRIQDVKPVVYVLADDENGKRVGLMSIDGGKTYKETWRPNCDLDKIGRIEPKRKKVK